MLVVYVFPSILLLAPLFKIFASVGLLNTWLSLIIMNVTFSAPFSVRLMRGFFSSIPYAAPFPRDVEAPIRRCRHCRLGRIGLMEVPQRGRRLRALGSVG
jgi:hypothetical protein